MRDRLDERQRRALAAAEAKVIGRGGVSQVAAATGLARGTIAAGMQELEGTSNEFLPGPRLAQLTATRRPGAKRPASALRGRRDLGQIGFGGGEQLDALARALLGQQRVATHDQPLAGEVLLAGELDEIALVEQ
jgi:hypothetical protein